MFPQFLQRAAHLRLDGSDGTAAYVGDFFISQIGILAQEKYFLLLAAEMKDGLA